jgi:hypothetical protein
MGTVFSFVGNSNKEKIKKSLHYFSAVNVNTKLRKKSFKRSATVLKDYHKRSANLKGS